jgi:predicted PurR-regulated permease PerM
MRQNLRSDILFAIAVLIGLYFVYVVADVLLLVYVSALFAVVLAPAIDVIRRIHIGKWRPSRAIAVLILIISLLGAVTLISALILPPILSDAADFAQNFPEKVVAIQDKVRHYPFMENFDLRGLQNSMAAMLGGAVGFFRGIAGGIFGVFSAIILTVYFILDGERAFHWALSMFAPHHRHRLEQTLVRGENRMRHWLVGQAMLMFILGSLCCIVFAILKLKYFYALALIAGLLNIVPIIGPVVAVTLASIVALVDSPAKLIGVLVFFLLYQQLETGFLTPRIMKFSVDLPPLAVIISLMIGGALAGVLGALVAVPTAALCAVIIDEYLIKDNKTEAAAHE